MNRIAVLICCMVAIMANAADLQEFEGRYQVGTTSCKVKPVKMAFELRWARGKGVQIFFFEGQSKEGKYTYATDSQSKTQDRFVFDPENFSSGIFIRADGKEFPVKRAP